MAAMMASEFRRERGVDGTGESFGAWHPTFRRLAEIAAVACRFPCRWICSFLSLTVAMLYIRFGCQISLGGREWAGLCALV